MPSERSLLQSVAAESPVLPGTRRPGGIAGAQSALHHEMAREMALALGRSAEHVTDAIAAIERVDQALCEAIERAADVAEIRLLQAEARSARRRAEQRLWELMVHREALGLFDHSILQRFHRIPPLRYT